MKYKYFDELFLRYPVLLEIKNKIMTTYELLRICNDNNGTVFMAGNGGSRADSYHIAGELMKGFLKQRPIKQEAKDKLKLIPGGEDISDLLQEGFPAIPLGGTVLSSAISNDTGSQMEFAQPLYVLGRKGDVLIGISTSGNAVNVCNAAIVAKAYGISVISLTGESGGKLQSLSDVCITVPETDVYKVQELHLPVYHAICAQLEEDLFD